MERKNNIGLRIFLNIVAILLVLIIGALIFLGKEYEDELASIETIEEIKISDSDKGEKIYSMQVQGNYYMDAFLERNGVKSTEDLVKFIIHEMSRGFADVDKLEVQVDSGCSTFTARDDDGAILFARNYDMGGSRPLLLMHTEPDDGRYKSVTTVNTEFIGISDQGLSSYQDKFTALAGVYVPMDGMNEKGLSIAIHMSHQGPGKENIPTDLNTGKLNLTSTSLLRMILDKAANVDEAVEIAKNCDMHDDIGQSFHYILADKSGKTAVIQWVGESDSTDTDPSNRNFKVIYGDEQNPFISSENYRILTNFITVPNYYEKGDSLTGLERMEKIDDYLSKADGKIADENEAFKILEAVSMKEMKEEGTTMYSVVYNLSKDKVSIIPYEKYDKAENKIDYEISR